MYMCWELTELKEPGPVKERRFFKHFTENNYRIQQIRIHHTKNLWKYASKLKKKKKEKNDNSEVIISFKMLENTNRWPVC